MMRKLATTMGVLAAVLTLGVAVPASAQAASGQLAINNQTFQDPSGCVQIPDSGNPFTHITNDTDAPVYVLSNADCTGEGRALVRPGEETVVLNGKSVLVLE
ncbi:hypothetical protein [Streptomyces sp. NPDC127066]|uniref:hypothetical protein n=1 Tax=Streptomyces sp. NPDC127066 TaxID=3347125 RepID=UPI0036485234